MEYHMYEQHQQSKSSQCKQLGDAKSKPTQCQKLSSYFSELREVSHASVQSGGICESESANSDVCLSGDSIVVVSRGGTRFQLPMDQKVSRVLPLVEGILIEFKVKHQVKLHEVLYFQKHRNEMEVEDALESFQKYCYATLTRHPYNPLKMLAELNNNNNAWYNQKEQITYASSEVPFLISYNEELNRNAFHTLLCNVPDVRKEYQHAVVPSHTYSLKDIVQVPHYDYLTQLLFEQSQGNRIVQVRLNKSVKKGHMFLYAYTVHKELYVYEIDFYRSYNSTQLIHQVSNVDCIVDCPIYNPHMFVPPPFKTKHTAFLSEILKNQLNTLREGVAVYSTHNGTTGTIGYFHNGSLIFSQEVSRHIVAKGNKLYYNNDQQLEQVCVNPLVQSGVDSFILSTLEVGTEDQRAFLKCLSTYAQNGILLQALTQMQQSRPSTIFLLHLLYQQCKLYEFMAEERKKLQQIQLVLGRITAKPQYVDYYLREGGSITALTFQTIGIQADNVFDIFQVVSKLLSNTPIQKDIFTVYNRTKFVLEYFQLLLQGECTLNIECVAKEVSMSKYQQGKESFYQSRYPLASQKGFHIDYYTLIYEEKELSVARPQSKEQKAFIYLIKNNCDVTTFPHAIRACFNQLLRRMRRELPYSLYQVIPEVGFMLIHRQDLYKNIQLYRRKTIQVPYHLQKPSLDDHIKTLVHTSTSQEYFLTSNASQMNKANNDLVFEEVNRLLCSTSDIKVRVKDIESIPEDKWEIESQNILLKVANRKLAIMVGQGAFSLGISRSFITEVIKVPKINLSGVMPNDIRIVLDLKQEKETVVHWPQFHAGLSAGLKLSRHVIPLSEQHLKTWIFYQKPQAPRRDHSGFLLSLGLLGYLKCFSLTDIYQYLKPNNEFTSVGVLLGVAASNIGRSDEALSKALLLHVPVLLPPNIDIDIPINVQTSALIAVGLLHKGTCNRTMTEMALSQIGKRPISDKCLEREGYSLAAGWALGMICLGMRRKKESFRDLQLEERLVRFSEGGKVMPPPQSMISTSYKNQAKCSSIMEGNDVNLHVTAPAALLAISLMYLKSNDGELAQRITIPNSFSTIEQCNPNHILLKTLAKNLIMWDNIGHNRNALLQQVPQLIKFIFQNPLSKVYERYYLIYNVSEIDYQTVTAIYVGVLTGAVLAMALRYAGTGHAQVVYTILEHIQLLRGLKITKCQFANDPLNKNLIDQHEQFSLLSTSVLALSIVQAGSCDVNTLRLIRVLRKKLQDNKIFHYGFSMSLNMALGFVFLGYGNYTFNREDLSVAALLIAAYPQFPSSPSDNRWHLQALRHFYVLALEEKIFHAVDVDTNKVVHVGAKMTFITPQEEITEDLHTPVLLQESKRLVRLQIKDEDYFDVDFAFDPARPDPKVIYIKHKHFKHINPALLHPENVLSTPHTKQLIYQSLNKELRYSSILTKTKPLAKLLPYVLPGITNERAAEIASKVENKRCIEELYFKLLKEDRCELLEIYLFLQRELRLLIQGNSSSDSVSSIPLLLNLEKMQGLNSFRDLIESELNKVHEVIMSDSGIQKYLRDPYKHKLTPKMYKMLKIAQVPSSRELMFIRKAVQKDSSKMEMLLYMTYPDCNCSVLKSLLQN